MPSSVVIPAGDLFTHRGENVRRLLKEFADETVVVDEIPTIDGRRLSAANLFTRHRSTGDRRFSIVAGMIYGSYHEEWLSRGTGRSYVLRRAYMNAYLVDEAGEREFAALHCDLDDADRYKQGPHLHLWIVGDPLSHAHVALNLGHLSQVTSSVYQVTKAMRGGLIMLRKEIAQRYCDHMINTA